MLNFVFILKFYTWSRYRTMSICVIYIFTSFKNDLTSLKKMTKNINFYYNCLENWLCSRKIVFYAFNFNKYKKIRSLIFLFLIS